MTVKAVLLDLDNTLYPYEQCNRIALEVVIDKLSTIFNIPKEIVETAFDKSRESVKFWLKDTASSHSRFLYFQKTIEMLKGSTDVKLTQDINNLFWNIYFGHMKLYDGAIEFLEYLKKSGIKIAIASDLLVDIQFKKLLKLGLENHVDFVITSEEAGQDKPAKFIFVLALEKLGLKKDEIVFIGDDLKKDIQGAKDMELKYILVKNGDFREVLESFKKLNLL